MAIVRSGKPGIVYTAEVANEVVNEVVNDSTPPITPHGAAIGIINKARGAVK